MKDYSVYLEDYEDELETQRFVPMKAKRQPTKKRREAAEPVVQPVQDEFTPTFGSLTSQNHMSNHEREWIQSYLGGFFRDHLISDVLRRVKGGKEATVYCCLADPATGRDLLAGKVYHPRAFRNLRNDSLYREGRDIQDEEGNRGSRQIRAMKKKTDFGQALRHGLWLGSEYATLKKLHAAGADVPEPVSSGENAILMEYIGEGEWPAPPLVHVTLNKEEAKPLFERIMHNIELMLANDRIHADLSAFNILYWEGEIKIIDFPQAVDPYINPHAYTLLTRDVERIVQYFTRYGITAEAAQLTAGIWKRVIPS